MKPDLRITRRLLLGHGVAGTFLAPGLLHAALAGVPVRRPIPSRLHVDRRQLPLVMLDAGHGGKDPGAVGYAGTYEKYVALAAALELRRLLEASGQYRVALTRMRDVFIPLDGRVDRAHSHGASLFVSMHADALPDSSVRGASVYTMANTASDAQTAILARRENSADRFAGPGFANQPPEVARILASLVRQETRVDSARMARDVVLNLGEDITLLTNPSRHARFVVLKAADIPSVLVEMGFMSNPRDETSLRRPDHRLRVASAMKRAVDAYFRAVPFEPGPTGGGTRMAG